MVTALPDREKVPFQTCVIACPLANENCKLQPLMAVVPVLVMVRFTLNPPDH
jgi:hypothetical protein